MLRGLAILRRLLSSVRGGRYGRPEPGNNAIWFIAGFRQVILSEFILLDYGLMPGFEKALDLPLTHLTGSVTIMVRDGPPKVR